MDPFSGGFGIIAALVMGFGLLLFLLVTGAIIFAIVKATRKAAIINAAPEVSAAATVLDKRIETTGGGESMVRQTHFVSFQQPSGERFELEVPAGEFGLLAAGDQGTVSMKGTQYLGFAREIMR